MRNEKEFFISGYLMPPRNKQAFFDLKDSFINHIYLDYTPKEEITELALSLCDEFDIKAIIMTGWSRYDNPSFERVTKNAYKHPSFVGVNGLDEPIYEDFPSIFEELRKFNQTYNDKTFYVNMVNCNVPQKFIATDESINYQKLVDKYVKLVNEIKFDKTVSITMYPLMIDEETHVNKLHPKHLQSLAFINQAASKTGAEMYFFVQTMPFRTTHRKPSLIDLYFQVNSGICFGARGVQYFCYRTPDPNWEFNDQQYAMVLKDGTKTDIYYSVRKVNLWLKKLAEYYFDLEYQNTFVHQNSANKKSDDTFRDFMNGNNNSSSYLSSMYSTGDVLYGEFKSKDNAPAFFFTNYGEPSMQTKNYVEFSLINDRTFKVLLVSNSGTRVAERVFDRYSLLLDKGEGVLVITNYEEKEN